MMCLANSYATYMYNMYGDREEQLIVVDSKSVIKFYCKYNLPLSPAAIYLLFQVRS